MNAIEVEELVVEYKRQRKEPLRAVDKLTFAVQEGEIVGFLGLNGAGKSSTMKALMGFQPPSGGNARIFGTSIESAGARDEVGFLPETALYSPYLTPSETLWVYGELHGMTGKQLKSRIVELLELVGIPEKSRSLNRTLSKGMLQRVGIAQALLSHPRLLVLDEVSSGLDPIGRRDLRNLLQQQQQQGVTVFFSSHQLAEVDRLCDRILIIHQGKLIANRCMSELRGHVQSLETYFVELIESGRDSLAEANL